MLFPNDGPLWERRLSESLTENMAAWILWAATVAAEGGRAHQSWNPDSDTPRVRHSIAIG